MYLSVGSRALQSPAKSGPETRGAVMVTKAVILIETDVGKTREVCNTLKAVGGTHSVDVVTGPFDVIAVIEAADMRGIGTLIEENIHPLVGVVRTVTCVAIGD